MDSLKEGKDFLAGEVGNITKSVTNASNKIGVDITGEKVFDDKETAGGASSMSANKEPPHDPNDFTLEGQKIDAKLKEDIEILNKSMDMGDEFEKQMTNLLRVGTDGLNESREALNKSVTATQE